MQGALGYIDSMRQSTPSREPASVEVPAFETDGNLLALLPREALTRIGRASGKRAHPQVRTDIKIVVVGENRDFSVLAAEIKGAWLLHEASGTPPGSGAHASSLDHLLTYLVASAFDTALPLRAGGSAVTALIARFGRALSRAATIAGDDLIYKALERPTDIGAVVELLRSTAPLLSAEQDIDPQLKGTIASLDAEDALIQRAGGIKDAKWVGEYLSISPKSVAAKARRNELLAISRGDRNLYPAFQFKSGQIVPGVRELLEVLPLTNGWSRMSFLLAPDPGLDDRSPIEAFKTDPEAALDLARNADTQGAA
jgi:hypothetical protein